MRRRRYWVSAEAGGVWTEERSEEGRRCLGSLGAGRAERAQRHSAEAGGVWTEERSDEGRRCLGSLGAGRAERAQRHSAWATATPQYAAPRPATTLATALSTA